MPRDQKVLKIYQQKDISFFKYKKPKYLYHVDVYRITQDESYRIELFDSGEFETDEFIGLSFYQHINSKKFPGASYSKYTELLAAPSEYIENNNLKPLTNVGKNRTRKSTNGNSKTKV